MLSPDQQQELLDNVVEEFTYRLRQGKRPAIEEFVERHPDLAIEIEELLTSVAMIEELKTQSNSINDSLKNEMKQITRLERIGDYRIIRELGRGGMGVVFEAIHESLGRRVAIKVMPNRKFDDQKYLERFRREAQAAANLHHTNIVSVFGIGQTGEHHYYVMEFVDGESLSGILKRLNASYESNTEDGKVAETMPLAEKDSFIEEGIDICLMYPQADGPARKFNSPRKRYRWAAQIGAELADGLAYAHGLGVLHRDVKPANLLIDKHETVWLTDFGLVKNISNQSITKTGDIIGTPQYMAPESFEGNYDKRSETYCLGLTLYEMATLKPAYENASTPELIRRITTTSPVPPRKFEPRIPRDLNRIIEKSISREPNYRYQSAAEMRDDLRAFLDDRPISARKISLLENMWRWSRRNPFQAFLSFASALMLLTIAVGATVALVVNSQQKFEIQQRLDAMDVQVRATKSARALAEEAIDVTVQFYDKLFKSIVFANSDVDNEFSLDGFGDLEGVAATIKESDAELLDQMMQFYLSFANNKKNQANLQLKTLTAFSYRRVGNIYHLTGQFDKAVDSYSQAIETYDAVRLSSPGDIQTILDLVRTINECGNAYVLRGSPNDRKLAEKQFARSIEILREQTEWNTGTFETIINSELAKSLLLKGTPTLEYRFEIPKVFEGIKNWMPDGWFANSSLPIRNVRMSDSRRSKNEIESALEISNQLIDEYVERQSNRLMEASTAFFKSQIEYLNWKWNEARISQSFTWYKLNAYLAEHQRNEELRYLRAVGLTRLGTIELATRNVAESRQSLRTAAQLMNDLIETDQNNPEYKFLLAQIRSVGYLRSLSSRSFGNRESARSATKSLNHSKQIMIGLVAQYDNNLDYRLMLGEVCFRLGILNRKSGELELALRNFEMANEMFALLMPQTPRSRPIQSTGLYCLMHFASSLMDNGEYEEAIECIQRTIDAEGDVRSSHRSQIPRNARSLRQAILYRILHVAYTQARDPANAYSAWKKAMDYYVEIERIRRQVNRKRLPRTPN